MSTEVLHIEALTYGPAAIARRPDGKTVFVEGGVPGDTVCAQVLEEKPSFARARVSEVVHASEDRVEPKSGLADVEDSCPWMHVAYPAQLKAKHTNVVDALVRIAGMDQEAAQNTVEACTASTRQLGYRNKIELACGTGTAGRLNVGMAKHQGSPVTELTNHPLAHKAIARAPRALQGALRYLEGANPGQLGIHRIGVRHSQRTGSCEVALWSVPGPFPRKVVASTLADALDTTSIVRVLADAGRQRKVKGVEALSGEGSWRETLSDFEFRVSAPSFFQVNTEMAEVLVRTVVEGLNLAQGSRVADLYCGAGTFTLPLAALGCDVSAVESAGTAVRDLRRNLDAAGLFADVVGGDAARELAQLGELDALVVDPPRTGLADGVAESIANAHPNQVAYVSCDPATWARDVARLAKCGYSLERVVPVDLFPHTYHCELVSFFTRH